MSVRGGCNAGCLKIGTGWWNLEKGERGMILPCGTVIGVVKKSWKADLGVDNCRGVTGLGGSCWCTLGSDNGMGNCV